MQRSNTILTRDGTRIWLNCYTPDASKCCVMVVAPAAGLTHKFYHLFALYCKEQGFTVITFDYRGVGDSAPQQMKGYKATVHDWAVQDINAVLLYARNNYPNQEIVYVGHGVGGEIIGLAPASQYINKMVLVNSSLTCEKLWPLHLRVILKYKKITGRLIIKLKGFLPGDNQKASMPGGVFQQMANWCDSPNGLFDSYPDNNYRRLNVPALVYSFTDDWLCPSKAVKELLDHFSNASITWYHIKPKEIGLKRVGHVNFFYLSMKQVLWHPMMEWLKCEQAGVQGKNFFIKKDSQ